MGALFRVVGSNHGVTEEQVHWHLTHRRTELDLAVILTFIALYAWAATVIVRRVCRRNMDRPESWGWVVLMVYTSVIASAIGVLLGEAWSDLMERLGMFVGGVALFWLLAALQHRGRSATPDVLWTSAR